MMYWNTVNPDLKKLILHISENPAFEGFRLGGGTALALQLGHRVSIDADFIAEKIADKSTLADLVEKTVPETADLYIGEHGVFLKAGGIKLDFLSWNLPFIRNAVIEQGVRMLHLEEIAAMKLFAITRRGEKKDYYDIALLLKQYPLEQLLGFYRERHPSNDYSLVLRLLTSFSDLDNQAEPHSIIGFNWQEAKEILMNEVRVYLEKLI